MSDKLISTNGAARSGGIDLNTRGDANISGDAVGRDKIVNQLIQPPSGVLALHQLPPPPPDFTGRQSDLADLLDQFQQGTTIFGIHGEGGIGKTALALKLAERLSEQYSEAQIFLDLKGSSSTPLSAYDIMAYIIRSFQPAAKLPEDKDRLTAAYRSVLFEQHTLLLLDNIRGAEQIQPLWPPSAGCGVIVTSRFHFTLPGLSSKNLTTLSTADARALLLRITPRIGERADEIAKLCGYLPLALRPVASQLKMRESLTPASCIEKLSDEPRRLKFLSSAADYSGEPSVDAALAASCDLLSERLRKLWRMVSIFPKEFDAVEAGAVWALDFETTSDRLDDLTRYSLIEYRTNTTHWHFHDLVRIFAEQSLTGNERGEAWDNINRSLGRGVPLWQNRALLFGEQLYDPEWRLKEIRSSVLEALWNLVDDDAASNPGGHELRRRAALELLNLHWWSDDTENVSVTRLLSFLELVASAADSSDLRLDLIGAISAKLNMEMHLRQRAQLFIHRAALQAQLYHFLDKANQLSAKGQQLSIAMKQNYAEAEQLLHSLLDSREALPEDHRQLARVYMGKGNFALIEASPQDALEFYSAALKAAQDYGQDPTLVVKVLEEFCNAYALYGDLDKAQEQYATALNLLETELRTTLDPQTYSTLYFLVQNSGAEMHRAQAEACANEPQKAQTEYEAACQLTWQAIAQLEQYVGDSENLSIAYFSVGEYLQALHEITHQPELLDEAHQQWQRARDIAHRRGVWSLEHMADNLLKSPNQAIDA